MFVTIADELQHVVLFIGLIIALGVVCWGLLILLERRSRRRQWHERMYNNAKHTSKHKHGK